MPGQMGPRAEPWPVLGARHQPCTHRVHLDIAGGRRQMRLVHHHSGEAALTEIATPAFPEVHKA